MVFNKSLFAKYFLFLSLALFYQTTSAQDRLTGEPFATRSEVIAQNGMAATSQPLATQVALDILKKGGHAVDAAIAANATLGLMEPTGNGMGGDLFAIVWDAEEEKLYGLNASGRSPYNLSLSYFTDNNYKKIPALGPLPVSVPGCVDGWQELHDRWGQLKMEQVLQPAIDYATKGFPVSELIAYYWGRNAEVLKEFPHFAATFMPDGAAPQKGEIFSNPRLAYTLKKVAQGGRDSFYFGTVAQRIVEAVQSQGGFLSERDLADHRSEWVEPLSTNYRGYDVWELPPNGQGTAVLQMLNILEGYDIAGMGFASADYIHHLVEAKKLAFEDRAQFYADPDFFDSPINELISKGYAAERRALIDSDRAARAYPAGELEQGNTIYLTTADADGNMVSLIQSNYRGMGSGVTPEGLGFVLQDRGELFSLEKGHANVYAPHKRPFHTIIPAFITKDGKPLISFGLMGGAMQPQGHTQIVCNLIDFEMNLQEAGDAPRIRHSGSSQPTGNVMRSGGRLYLESGFSPQVLRELTAKGHDIRFTRGGYGGYQAIYWERDQQVYYGASESRKDGQAAGY
jgi:gamma-glutamyltranspeptidase/glutathione hydrolase